MIPIHEQRDVYVYEFEDGRAYVGSTFSIERRHREHSKSGRMLSKLEGVDYRLVNFGRFPTDIAIRNEDALIQKYRADGWSVLNKNKAGAIGKGPLKWTRAAVEQEALKYTCRRDFRERSNGAYQAAKALGVLAVVCSHMPYLRNRVY